MKNKVIYFCLKCHQESSYKDYWQNSTSEYTSTCQKCSSGKLVALDFKIQPVIKKLLKKNYITQFSCSGHEGDNFSGFPYISFYHNLQNLPHPQNWEWDTRGYSSLYAKTKQTPTQEKLDSLIMNLDQWVDTLPVNKGDFSNLICREVKEKIIERRKKTHYKLILLNEDHNTTNQMVMMTEDLNLDELKVKKIYAKVNKTLDVLNLNNIGWGILNNPTPALVKKYREILTDGELYVWDYNNLEAVRIY